MRQAELANCTLLHALTTPPAMGQILEHKLRTRHVNSSTSIPAFLESSTSHVTISLDTYCVKTFADTKTCQVHNPSEDRNLSVSKCAKKYVFFPPSIVECCGLLVTKLTSTVLVGFWWPNMAPRWRRGSAFGEGIGWFGELVSCLVEGVAA